MYSCILVFYLFNRIFLFLFFSLYSIIFFYALILLVCIFFLVFFFCFIAEGGKGGSHRYGGDRKALDGVDYATKKKSNWCSKFWDNV
ncbi:hypothetical protein CW304_29575 [Bacillus sp. UFRGS-B20]|nr:hypothetical protein CW304_29575 [Bacillus sp. UFRGS-B20]